MSVWRASMAGMKRSKGQFARVMALDRKIREGAYPNCLTFARAWEVSQKTVQRDVDFLRDQMGAPVAYSHDRKGFYYENPAWVLPSFVLGEGELVSLLIASRMLDEYRGGPMGGRLDQLYAKLASLLPEQVTFDPGPILQRFSFVAPPGNTIKPEVWKTVVHCLANQCTMKARYLPFDATPALTDKWSRINPLHVANLQGEWYLFGTHDGHDDVRQFALCRFQGAEATPSRFEPPANFDRARLLKGVWGRFAGVEKIHQVSLLFRRDAAPWVADRVWHPEQKLLLRRSGQIALSFPAKGLFEVQRWVLSWGSSVRVLGPAELKRSVEREIAAMARRLAPASK